jgi:hypothetical protein
VAGDAGTALRLRVPVQLTVRLLGTEVLHISTDPEHDDEGTHSSGGSFELGFATTARPMDGEASDTASLRVLRQRR